MAHDSHIIPPQESGTWRGAFGITVDYTRIPGTPRTATEPETADEVEIETVYWNNQDIGEICDILESNGCQIWEQLQETIVEAQPWNNQ